MDSKTIISITILVYEETFFLFERIRGGGGKNIKDKDGQFTFPIHRKYSYH